MVPNIKKLILIMLKLKTFFKKEWKFTVKKNIDILLLDDGYVNFKLKGYKSHLLFNEAYIFIIIKSVFFYFFYKSNKSLYEVYFQNLVNKINPKIAIGHDKNGKIFIFKKLFPNKISIAYQFGYIFDHFISSEYKKKLSGRKVDYYFVFDDRSKKILKKIIKSNYVISGSVKGNEYLKKIKKRTIYDIMFISSYRPINKSQKDWELVKFFNDHDKYLFNMISNICQKNKFKLSIALSSTRKDKKKRDFYNSEIKYFRKISNKFMISKLNSYELSEKANLCIGTFSNLAYELLLSKKKVSIFYKDKKRKRLKFPQKENSKFIFYTKKPSYVEKKIKYLLKMSENKWTALFKSFYSLNVIDYNNKILKNLIQKELKKI